MDSEYHIIVKSADRDLGTAVVAHYNSFAGTRISALRARYYVTVCTSWKTGLKDKRIHISEKERDLKKEINTSAENALFMPCTTFSVIYLS